MDELTVLSVSDSSYLGFVRTLFNSVRQNVKVPHRFHLHAINVSDEEIKKFKDEYVNIEFTRDKIKLDKTPNKNNAFKKSKKAAYCANIRAKILYDIMCKETKYILYLDADSVVRKDLNDLFLLLKTADLVIFRRDESKSHNVKVATGVIGINNNEKSFSFIKSWKDSILRKDILYSWYSDQIYFYKTMMEHSDVYIKSLPFSYIDTTFLDTSVIWVGKADRKFNNDEYIREMEKYK